MNVATAEEAGMHAIQYVDRETLMQELRDHGIKFE